MLHIIYEFVKFFSFIFLLSGMSCLFNGLYSLAFLQLGSFLLIKGVDSDWAFNVFKFKNHNGMVLLISFAIIIINITAIYQNMQNNPIFIRATDAEKRTYIAYENQLFSTISECSRLHNEMLKRLSDYIEVSSYEQENINNICSDAILNIEKITIPYDKVPEPVLPLLGDIKNDIKYISLNLSNYEYTFKSGYNDNLNTLLNMNVHDMLTSMQEARKMLRLSPDIEDSKKYVVKLEQR